MRFNILNPVGIWGITTFRGVMSRLVSYKYWLWENAIPESFCTAALERIEWATAAAASIIEEAPIIDPNIRRTDIKWENALQPMGCIARCYIDQANQSAGWNFILGSQEDTQFGRYKSSDQGFYDWHMDAGPPQNGVQRKLSCVILLNDASEFEGGVLQFKGMEDENILTKRGSVIVFPSFVEHKVTPVTKGVRYTAVSWASGPAFI